MFPYASVFACIGLAVGCLDSGFVPCGNIQCPSSLVCVGGQRCASPNQISACNGAADGESCVADQIAGACEGGVCVPSSCGNGAVDPGEVCDDGNMVSGDGCRGDCRKIEVCGDGELDAGEACDDGNTNPVDGCNACRVTT